MRKLINRILEKNSIVPYKTITLKTGVVVDHYRNGLVDVS
jgi:hypothetical protein